MSNYHLPELPVMAGATVSAAGVGTLIAGIVAGLPVLIAGAALIPIGSQVALFSKVVAVIREVHGPSRVMFDKGYQMGKDSGYWEGRRVARPVVVPMLDQEGGSVPVDQPGRPFFSR